VRQARAENDKVVVSIFVNPTQFGPHEDLSRYPRDVARDVAMLAAEGVDLVFTPSAAEIYPPDFSCFVEVRGPLATQAEGASRPGHFAGVCTVVLKLFQLVQPKQAYFGQKDAQQVAVITRMVKDFNLPIALSIGPTVREPDGLAMSSRNKYLDATNRIAATVLYRALQAGHATFTEQMQDAQASPQTVVRTMSAVISSESLARLEYAEVRHPDSFLLMKRLQAPAILLIAAQIGSVRLIDNLLLGVDNERKREV
jgi:pantoate--beta-alanine ligase